MNNHRLKINKPNRYIKQLFVIILFISATDLKANAQNDNAVHSKVDSTAIFPGDGLDKLIDYVTSNIVYPAKAKENNVQGTVFISFVIETDGSIDSIKIMHGIGSGCDEEVVRVLKASRGWGPAKLNNLVVRSKFTVPIIFSLPGSKTPDNIQPVNDVFAIVEHEPEFPGGMEGLTKYLAKTIRYPESARNNNIHGKVFVTFVVEKNGRLSNIKIMRGIGGGCDEEAVRLIAGSPKWSPGTQNGQPVRAQFTIPINFAYITN